MMKSQPQDNPMKQHQNLRKQRDLLAFRMKKLSSKQSAFNSKTATLKDKIKKKYDDMKRVLDEDLRITLSLLDTETEAMERTLEDRIEKCYRLTQEIDEQLAELLIDDGVLSMSTLNMAIISEMQERIAETLEKTDPELMRMDEFKNEQLFGLTINLLLFIRSQVPVTKKLFQTYVQDVVLDPDSAHPKLIISPEGDTVTYTDSWQEVPENPARFDTTLNVISRKGFTDVRNYWEVQVTGKTYWELGLTYPSIPRKGREEDCWLGRDASSWCIEYFNGAYTAWHDGVPQELTHVSGRSFQHIGIFSTAEGGLVCFLGADTMTPLYSFYAGNFTNLLFQAVCPGHDNQGTNWKPLVIWDPSKSRPIL
ncbi:hypothetical protein DNTS_013662 [Danionella cerebrum]|uniref:B30.2/SPRY domain-containing protein n=1 Tax=Danionella cerebrum TaxID=2873325 RepID=A0A553N4H8_9TELE|nr:hypothetical protein DNTS_013662 [Danionella translucida]